MWATTKKYAPAAGLAYAGVTVARALPVPFGLPGRIVAGVVLSGLGVYFGMKLAS